MLITILCQFAVGLVAFILGSRLAAYECRRIARRRAMDGEDGIGEAIAVDITRFYNLKP